MFSLILLSILLIFIYSLRFLYILQIKEYRLDRFMSSVREKGAIGYFYSLRFRLPKKSPRNFIIVMFIIFTLFMLLLLSLENIWIYYLMTLSVFVAPYAAYGLIFLGIQMTAFPSSYRRGKWIQKAAKKAKESRAVFIGVTGSYGKTTVKEYLYELLSTHYRTSKTMDNMNTDVGVAISILKHLYKDTQYFVTEVGAYRKGEIKKITKFVPFSYAILTGLGNQHLDLYGNRENLIDEETYILYRIPKKKNVYINYDIPVRKQIARDIEARRLYYGIDPNTDITAKIIHKDYMGTTAEVTYGNETFEIQTHIPGTHTIINLLPAIGLALDLDVPLPKIIRKIKSFKPITGKQSVHKGIKHSLMIDDSLNSNVEGFLAAIELLQMYPQTHKIILSQGIIELGVEKRQSYEKILNTLTKTNIKLYTTDQLFTEFDKKGHVVTFNDVKSLYSETSKNLDYGTVILIEGRFPIHFITSIRKEK